MRTKTANLLLWLMLFVPHRETVGLSSPNDAPGDVIGEEGSYGEEISEITLSSRVIISPSYAHVAHQTNRIRSDRTSKIFDLTNDSNIQFSTKPAKLIPETLLDNSISGPSRALPSSILAPTPPPILTIPTPRGGG